MQTNSHNVIDNTLQAEYTRLNKPMLDQMARRAARRPTKTNPLMRDARTASQNLKSRSTVPTIKIADKPAYYELPISKRAVETTSKPAPKELRKQLRNMAIAKKKANFNHHARQLIPDQRITVTGLDGEPVREYICNVPAWSGLLCRRASWNGAKR